MAEHTRAVFQGATWDAGEPLTSGNCLCGHPADTCQHAPWAHTPWRPSPIPPPEQRDYPPCPVLTALAEHAAELARPAVLLSIVGHEGSEAA